MTRDEHLEWCKQRAREYLARGDVPNAITSMLSDLGKHEELRAVADNPHLAMFGMMTAANHDIEGARRFVEGFR